MATLVPGRLEERADPGTCRASCRDYVSVVEGCRYDQKRAERPADHRGRRGTTDGSHGRRRGSTSVAKAALGSVVSSYPVGEERPRTSAQGLERGARETPSSVQLCMRRHDWRK